MARSKKADTESGAYDHRKPPKHIHHLEIHPRLGGGHRIEHHYHDAHLPGHEPAVHEFGADEGDAAMEHIGKHAGIDHNLASMEGSGAENEIAQSEQD